jgi:hypothetical protein
MRLKIKETPGLEVKSKSHLLRSPSFLRERKVLCSLLVWMGPVHIVEDKLVYTAYTDLSVNHKLKYPHRNFQNNV